MIGVERDAATATLAAANVPEAGVVLGDAERPPLGLDRMAVLIDPSRRGERGRRFDPASFSPPWDACLSRAWEAPAAVIKAAPALPADAIPPEAEVEYVQVGRSVREATLWLSGDAEPGLRRAVLLPQGVELDGHAPNAGDACRPPGPFVFDPEPCVTLAGVVTQLAHRLGAQLMDPMVAYLTGDGLAFDPLAATFRVLEVVPFSVARLRRLLRERGWRPDEIRRRAFPVEPDELRRLLGRLEGERVALLCTTLEGRRTVFVAERVAPDRQ